jgi:hypothetical protein
MVRGHVGMSAAKAGGHFHHCVVPHGDGRAEEKSGMTGSRLRSCVGPHGRMIHGHVARRSVTVVPVEESPLDESRGEEEVTSGDLVDQRRFAEVVLFDSSCPPECPTETVSGEVLMIGCRRGPWTHVHRWRRLCGDVPGEAD